MAAEVGFRRDITLGYSVSLLISTIIGTGIFVSPVAILKYSGSFGLAMVIWVISGFLAILDALVYMEVATILLSDGGYYTFLYEAYGQFISFMKAWIGKYIIF